MDKSVTEFFMKMEKVPTVTAQERRVRIVKGKPVFYDSPRIKSAKALLIAHLKQHRPPKPYDSGVRLRVSWLFPKGRHKDGEYRTTKPDTDNLQKMLKDCMTKCGYWKDDALVASEMCEKFWAEVPGIYIRIEEL
ncbi:RusA family crossover junction endodeoxyribonuclease [uncultured Ruminococcus sp.]|uniref:RusA family crossover junction endodeoxyribonuclease n=1 Tax=uncultured Ruminococcus sp. TaxID=165186 RepID=UPI0025DF73DC|nr:RusA family crossover junction endodeoxyribonuclease [uncultured Ruminococcus sp.]